MSLLKRKCQVGVDLGATCIKLAGLRPKGREFTLEFFEVIDLTEEYALDSFMKVTDDHYVEQLQKLDSKHNLKNARLSFLLPTNSGIIQVLRTKPSLTESELLDKIRHALRQATSEDLDEMQIVCHELQDDSQNGQVPILVCAIANDVIARYKRIIRKSGLKAAVLDLGALGVYNAFYHFSNELNCGATVVVHIGSHYSTCIILLPGKCPFFYLIKLGSDIAKQVRNKTKSTLNIGDAQESSTQNFLSSFSKNLLVEVKKCIRHIQSHEGISKFERIYLTGEGAQSDSLCKFFKESLQVETKSWNPVKQFVKKNNQEHPEQGFYLAPAIGSALRGD